MSQKGVAEVIGNLIMDADFQKKFNADPDAAVKGFDLTAEEKAALKKLKGKNIASMSANEIAGALAGGITGPTALAA